MESALSAFFTLACSSVVYMLNLLPCPFLSFFSQLLSHLSVPDESFCCVKMRAKVNYLGMLKDGRFLVPFRNLPCFVEQVVS